MASAAPSRRCAFFGNRFFVLEAMLEAGLSPAIGAVAGSHLERRLKECGLAFTACADRSSFLAWLEQAESELFVANGCPYRIPAEAFRAGRRFVNVHPSFLPDLRVPRRQQLDHVTEQRQTRDPPVALVAVGEVPAEVPQRQCVQQRFPDRV